MDMKIEVVLLPVSDVDRANHFSKALGWREDADSVADDFRIVQLAPPGSATSIQFGTGVSAAVPGSVKNVYLVVDDIAAARAELVERGVDVGNVFHGGGRATPARVDEAAPPGRLPGPDPQPSPRAGVKPARDVARRAGLLREAEVHHGHDEPTRVGAR